MTEKVNGYSFKGPHLTGTLNYYTFSTLLDITPSGAVEDFSLALASETPAFPFVFNGVTYATLGDYEAAITTQTRFDTLIQTISTRATPIIIGGLTVAQVAISTAEQTLPAAASASGSTVQVMSFMFAIEHNDAWEVTGNTAEPQPTLTGTLNGVLDFVNDGMGGSTNNFAFTAVSSDLY